MIAKDIRKFGDVEDCFEVGESVLAWNTGRECIVVDANPNRPVLIEVETHDGERMIRELTYKVDSRQEVYQIILDMALRKAHTKFGFYNWLLNGGND